MDPRLHEWLAYAPIKKPTPKNADHVTLADDNVQAIDSALADAAHPLKGRRIPTAEIWHFVTSV